MLDTIILSIPQDKFTIINYEAFNPSARGLYESPFYKLGSRGHFECFLNPTKKEKLNHEYMPRLTLSKRSGTGGFSIALKIELSLPKLLFGNNFQELDDEDFDKIIKKLHTCLLNRGIGITLDNIRSATVTGIHYWKNVIVTDYTTSALVIKTIEKLGITKRLDTGHTDFRNEGQAIRFHTNHYELSFYDKVKDLEQAKISEKRAIETDNYIQYDLFNCIRKQKIRPEILRMECRINNRRNIKKTLNENGIFNNPMTFESLYSKHIARTLLCFFWQKNIEPSLNIIVLSRQSADAIYTKMRLAGIKEMDAIKCIGGLLMIKELGIRGFKQLLSPKSNTYTRLNKMISNATFDKYFMSDVFDKIRKDVFDCISIRTEFKNL